MEQEQEGARMSRDKVIQGANQSLTHSFVGHVYPELKSIST